MMTAWWRERWAETAGRNGSSEAVGMGKVAATAVQRSSARPGHLCLNRETDGWAPHSFDFFSNLSKTGSTLKIQNG
jgi:hypothetical protein